MCSSASLTPPQPITEHNENNLFQFFFSFPVISLEAAVQGAAPPKKCEDERLSAVALVSSNQLIEIIISINAGKTPLKVEIGEETCFWTSEKGGFFCLNLVTICYFFVVSSAQFRKKNDLHDSVVCQQILMTFTFF